MLRGVYEKPVGIRIVGNGYSNPNSGRFKCRLSDKLARLEYGAKKQSNLKARNAYRVQAGLKPIKGENL
jgi:hypothetical protein